MIDTISIKIGTLVAVRFDSSTIRHGIVFDIAQERVYATFINEDGEDTNFSFGYDLISYIMNPGVRFR